MDLSFKPLAMIPALIFLLLNLFDIFIKVWEGGGIANKPIFNLISLLSRKMGRFIVCASHNFRGFFFSIAKIIIVIGMYSLTIEQPLDAANILC